ncbi:MAG: cell division FtsA domain-containing protein [Clostridia bacterium]|nr:cell division FtsA domain-containing protein [Clostridia bacterium]
MKNIAAAIDFGTSKIVTLIAQSGGFNRCDMIGAGNVPYDGYMNGDWNSPGKLREAVRNSINAAELDGKTKLKEMYVGVPCEYIRLMSGEGFARVASADGRVSDEDVANVQDDAADKLNLIGHTGVVIHRSCSWFSVDGGKKTMSPVGLKGREIRAGVSFMLADPAFIEDTTRLLLEMGIGVLGFLSPSMGESMLLLSLEDRDRVAVLIDIGYLNSEFSVIEGDAMVYHAVLPMGGGHIAADLASELQIPMRCAEQIKREYIFMPDEFDQVSDPEVTDESGRRLTFPRSFVKSTIEASVDELAEMITLAINDCESRLTARSQVFITGGGIAMMRGGREYLSGKLGRPVKVSMAKAAKLNSPVFASSLGLIDLVFDSIEQRTAQEDSLPGRLAGGLRGLFGKKS